MPFTTTYTDLLARLRGEVNTADLAPDLLGTPALVRRLYAAVLVVCESVPLVRLTLSDGVLSVKNVPGEAPSVTVYELPDLFYTRGDLGIWHVMFGEHVFPVSSATPPEEFGHLRGSPWLDNRPVFIFDPGKRELRALTSAVVKLRYAIPPPRPDAEDPDLSATIPLTAGDTETVVQLAAAHVTGVEGNDPLLNQMHSTFANLYSPAHAN